MNNKLEIFESDSIYHVYNRANGNEKLFLSDDNYRFFLRKYEEYIRPIADTLCYCLMPNHFHFLIRIKNEIQLKAFLLSNKPNLQGSQNKTLPKFQTLAEFNYSLAVSKKFANFFSSYTQAFNKVHHRKGTLFMKPFKRKRILDEKYLRKLIHYIHYNPVESGLVEKVQDWKYSSYQALVSDSETKMDRDEVLQIFENKSNFIYCHQTPPSMSGFEI